MIQKQITAYFCGHCNKLYQKKAACSRHEEMCNKNPANSRPCFSCSNLCKKKVDVPYDTFVGETNRRYYVLYCNAKQVFLYTPQNEIKDNVLDLGEDSNEAMPLHCDLQNIETIETK